MDRKRQPKLKSIFIQATRIGTTGGLKKLWKLGVLYRIWHRAARRRQKILLQKGLAVPPTIALSPTVRCNLSCVGCYAQDYPQEELPVEIIDTTIYDAEKLGVFMAIITGGEPFLRKDLLGVYRRHKNILFLVITNGTQIDRQIAQRLASLKNVILVVSLEGSQTETDWRRGGGVYERVRMCMANLREAGVLFGFSATSTRNNLNTLGSEGFIDKMIEWGCAIGFYTEYIPAGSGADWSLVLEEDERRWFRERVIAFRREKPIAVVHFPDDEYGSDGRCLAAGKGSLHINAQGYVEPCPFAHYALENIQEQTLEEVIRSPFLREIRAHPTILKRQRFGCALFENREVLREIADLTGAKVTDRKETFL